MTPDCYASPTAAAFIAAQLALDARRAAFTAQFRLAAILRRQYDEMWDEVFERLGMASICSHIQHSAYAMPFQIEAAT